MSRDRPLLVPARPGPPPESALVHLRFDESLIEAHPQDTLATALIAAGVLMSSRSPKYRRPRGPYCLDGDCGTCLVRVDGRPNVRSCMTPVREGMRVSSQNSYKPRRLDPTALVDRLFPGGIDHHHLMVRPRLANQVMQEFARHLTGFGELPAGVAERRSEHVEHTPEVLIIGAGPAGRAVARALAGAGVDHLIVDRHDRPQLRANAAADGRPDEPEPERLVSSTGVFGIYPGPRSVYPVSPESPDSRALVAASELADFPDSPDSPDSPVERLHTVRPRHLVFAVGSRDPMLPFANNDLPGVVSARGLVRALLRADARINGRCVVVGEGPRAAALRERLDGLRSPDTPSVELVAPADIERAVGGDRVEALECRGRRLSCALLAVAAPPAPAHELAAQAGVALTFDGAGFAIARTGPDHGRCGALGGTTLWAAGDVCGRSNPDGPDPDGPDPDGPDPDGPDPAGPDPNNPARDGERVGEALLAFLASARAGAQP